VDYTLSGLPSGLANLGGALYQHVGASQYKNRVPLALGTMFEFQTHQGRTHAERASDFPEGLPSRNFQAFRRSRLLAGRPSRVPCARVRASPAFVRSEIRIRSGAATAASTPMITSPKTPSESMYCSCSS
jgi:hypothetical protein